MMEAKHTGPSRTGGGCLEGTGTVLMCESYYACIAKQIQTEVDRFSTTIRMGMQQPQVLHQKRWRLHKPKVCCCPNPLTPPPPPPPKKNASPAEHQVKPQAGQLLMQSCNGMATHALSRSRAGCQQCGKSEGSLVVTAECKPVVRLPWLGWRELIHNKESGFLLQHHHVVHFLSLDSPLLEGCLAGPWKRPLLMLFPTCGCKPAHYD